MARAFERPPPQGHGGSRSRQHPHSRSPIWRYRRCHGLVGFASADAVLSGPKSGEHCPHRPTFQIADSVAASDHDRRPYVVYRTPILAQRWHGATRALAAPGCSTGSLSSSASTSTPPLPSRSTPSPPTCCTSWRRVCPCARSGQYPRAGAARPAGGPDPAPRLGTSRPGTAYPGLGLLKNAVMADAIPLAGLV